MSNKTTPPSEVYTSIIHEAQRIVRECDGDPAQWSFEMLNVLEQLVSLHELARPVAFEVG